MGIWDVIAGPLLKIIDKVIPDPQAKAQAQLQLLQLNKDEEFKQMETDLQLALGQLQVNKAEADSPSLFKGGWRPFIGWVCGVALAYDFLVQPLLSWASGAFWHVSIPPQLDIGTLIMLVSGMLGLGGLRTTEKLKGVAAS